MWHGHAVCPCHTAPLGGQGLADAPCPLCAGGVASVRLSADRASALARRAVADLAREVARVVVPVECAGCGALDEVLCDDCSIPLRSPPWRCEDGAPRLDRLDGVPPFPVWTLLTYSGVARDLVLGWKDRGRADLTRPLCAALRRAAGDRAEPLRQALSTGHGASQAIHVVPVPSSPAARRRRGADLVRRLAASVAGGLVERGVPARLDPCLAPAGAARDQVGLGVSGRQRNRARSVRLRGSLPPGVVVVLVDDVVTTGATLAACERAVASGGGLVVGALVLAATPRPTRSISGWRDR